MCDPRQVLFQYGPKMPKGWTPLRRAFSFLNFFAEFQPSVYVIFYFPCVYSKLPSTVVKANS